MVYEGLGAEVAEHMQRHTKALAECFKSNDHKEGVSRVPRTAPARGSPVPEEDESMTTIISTGARSQGDGRGPMARTCG